MEWIIWNEDKNQPLLCMTDILEHIPNKLKS